MRTFDRICWKQLEEPTNPYRVSAPSIFDDIVSNSFFAARKGDPFVKRWHDLFIHLWSNPPTRTNYLGLADDPLLLFLKDLPFHTPPLDLKVSINTFAEYATQLLCWRRMCRLSAPEKEGDGFDCTKYWQNNILPFRMLDEGWAAEKLCGWSGSRLFELLSLKVEPPQTENLDYQEAQKLVWLLLTKSSLQKVYNGKELLHKPALGALWSMPENLGKDCAAGTFAELLRFGAEHFGQTREEIEFAKVSPIQDTLHKGFWEP